ncbi:6-bladed beta-propeller protein [Balnearium lithotrophicum]|uniref:6-bladed beta-propeller protein n=1 Tax=Balnearium lithotrophicum TaxID=223788 RepID=A0A521AEZ8_9BACT|nr:NHL repeat-containing protein [Balnearium lithotrophicum]SMO33377.1 6-bladed beta-propeller protein [Balnearium lithotrophicum]
MKKGFLTVLFLVLMAVTTVAGEIKGNWKFPSDIAVSNGKLYVVDGLNNRISVYDLYGEHLTDIRIDSPYGIFAFNGLIYTVSQKGKLTVMDENGGVEKVLNLEGRPIDVVKIGSKLFVTDGKSESIDVYDLDGNLIRKVGGKGTAPGNFVGIFLSDASKNTLFVVDSVNARIQEFSKDGSFVRQFGKFGIEEGDLFRPKGVAYCGNGNLVVSDAITGALQLFNIYGGFERVIAKGLYYPTAVACYRGEVFVLEPLKNRVLTFKVQGVK